MSSNASLEKSIDAINDKYKNFKKIRILKESFVEIYEDKNKYENYFIFHIGKCVGVVIGGCTELHWFLKSKYRSKEIMLKALKKFIIPELFKNCKKINITIDESEEQCLFDESLNLAERIGFKTITEKLFCGNRKLKLEITKEYFNSQKNLEENT